MYPLPRIIYQMFLHRNDPKPKFGDIMETHHICWPWDLDIFWELNNGRTLTLYDIGRMVLGQSSELLDVLKKKGWGLTVAGSCPRYRRRIRLFDRFTMKTRAVCWDDKFMYLEQSMWKKNGECASHVLIRAALTDKNGIVNPALVAAEMGHTGLSPEMPDWIAAWSAAETQRPWPPMQG